MIEKGGLHLDITESIWEKNFFTPDEQKKAETILSALDGMSIASAKELLSKCNQLVQTIIIEHENKTLSACDIDEIVDIVAERMGIMPIIGRKTDTDRYSVDLSDGATPQEWGDIVAARLKISENQGT